MPILSATPETAIAVLSAIITLITISAGLGIYMIRKHECPMSGMLVREILGP